MNDGPIAEFLAELARHLRRDDENRWRIVCEVGDHLRDLAAEARARGLGDRTPDGPPRSFFLAAPSTVHARFAVRGVEPGQRVTIEFRDTNGKVVLTRARSHGRGLRCTTPRCPASASPSDSDTGS